MSLTVTYLEGTKFKVTSQAHSIIIDQPESDGGTDQGMTPVELLNGSLSGCATYYASLFLKRHVGNLKGLQVKASWKYVENPHRVGIINLEIILSQVLTDSEKAGLLRTVEHCTVENTLKNPPEIMIDIKG